MTTNLACLITVFLGSAIKGESPLGTVQLLWVNMIMDTLAALALSTERPHPSIIRTTPTKKSDLIMTPVMWRQIYGVGLYMVIVMLLVILLGQQMWGLDSYSSSTEFYVDNVATSKCTHFTLMFNTFVFLQIFN